MKNQNLEMVKGKDGVYTFAMVDEKNETKPEAKMEASMSGILDKIPDWHPGNIPVGEALRGMVAAGIGDAAGSIAIRYLPAGIVSGQYSTAILKAGTIALLNWKPVKNFFGPKAVETGSIILAYEGLASIFNARLRTYSMLAGIAGKLPGGAAQPAAAAAAGTGNVVVL